MKLLGVDDLERSGIVANCRMNRERNLTGTNGYSTDLGFNPLSLLEEKVACQDHVRWLDLCCGSGRALIEAVLMTKRGRITQDNPPSTRITSDQIVVRDRCKISGILWQCT